MHTCLVTCLHVPFNNLVSVASVISAACYVAIASLQHSNMFNKGNVQKPSDMQPQIAFVSRQEALTMICDITGLV